MPEAVPGQGQRRSEREPATPTHATSTPQCRVQGAVRQWRAGWNEAEKNKLDGAQILSHALLCFVNFVAMSR